jgi:hypothetical protein
MHKRHVGVREMYAPANLKEKIVVGRWMGRIVVGLSQVDLYI